MAYAASFAKIRVKTRGLFSWSCSSYRHAVWASQTTTGRTSHYQNGFTWPADQVLANSNQAPTGDRRHHEQLQQHGQGVPEPGKAEFGAAAWADEWRVQSAVGEASVGVWCQVGAEGPGAADQAQPWDEHSLGEQVCRVSAAHDCQLRVGFTGLGREGAPDGCPEH